MGKRDKTQIVVGLDAGSYRTRCIIAALEGDHMRYLAHGLAQSAGWVKGRVTDQQAVAESMRAAVDDAERGAGVTVTAVTLGIGGLDVAGAQGRGLYEFGRPHEVSAKDLADAVEMAADVRLEHDRMLLHVLPQDFTLDGKAGYRKPQRGVCSRLGANVHLLTASVQQHQAIVAAAHLAHLAVEETVFEAMAAAYACVRPDERSRGVAVVDLGMDSTGVVIYDGDRMLLGSNLEVASDHLTRDIAWIFKVSYEDAEALKQQYGCALLGLTADSSLIEVPSPEGRGPREARRSELIEILEARCEQMFRFVASEIERAGMQRRLLEGVMLTGAGALLNGMYDVAEKVLDCQTGYGLAKGIGDWPSELESPAWTVAAGLAMYSAKIKLHRPPERAARGLMGFLVK